MGVKVGNYYMNVHNQHAKYKQQFATMHVRGSVIDQVKNVRLQIENKQKKNLFVTIFHFLQQRCPMTNYESM